MSMVIDFVEWVRSGHFLNVTLGTPKSDVEARIGTPVGWAVDSTVQVASHLEADIWGYGVWSLYFEGGVLDAITCAVESLAQHGWYFDINNFDEKLLGGLEEVRQALELHGIQSRVFERRYRLRDTMVGETIEISRRLSSPTLGWRGFAYTNTFRR